MKIIKSDYSQNLPFSKDHCTTRFIKCHNYMEAMVTLAIINWVPQRENLLEEQLNQVCTPSFRKFGQQNEYWPAYLQSNFSISCIAAQLSHFKDKHIMPSSNHLSSVTGVSVEIKFMLQSLVRMFLCNHMCASCCFVMWLLA